MAGMHLARRAAMHRAVVVMFVAVLASCAAGEPEDACRAAAEHVADCTGQTAPTTIEQCDPDKAEAVLATECNQLDPSKGDGLWSSFLCALGFTSYCNGGGGGGGTQTTRTLTGNVKKLGSNAPAVGVYVRLVREDTGETRGSWTFSEGLFSIGDLVPMQYRLEVAFGPTATAITHQTIDVAAQSYVLVLAPVP